MIEIYPNQEYPVNIAPGRYVLSRLDAPYVAADRAYLVRRSSDNAPFIEGFAMIREDGDGLADGNVSDTVTSIPTASIMAVCDTVSEVNTVIETGLTSRQIMRNALEAVRTLHLEMDGTEIADDHARAFTLLNNSGDSTITWEKENDEVMRCLIEKKMKEGKAFFVIHPKTLGFIGRPKSRAKDLDEVMKRRSVAVRDRDFAEIIAAGVAGVTDRPEIDTERAEQSHDAAVIARSQSVGVMPMRGG